MAAAATCSVQPSGSRASPASAPARFSRANGPAVAPSVAPGISPAISAGSMAAVSPGASVSRALRLIGASASVTGMVMSLLAAPPPGSARSRRRVALPCAAPAVSGTVTAPRPPSASATGAVGAGASISSAGAATPSATSPAGPSVWVSATDIAARSPGARKRGAVTVMTTGSRMIVVASAWPSAVAVHATAMIRASPLKSGIGTSSVATPSGARVIGPECHASNASVGGGASAASPAPASPPCRSAPSAAPVGRISRP